MVGLQGCGKTTWVRQHLAGTDLTPPTTAEGFDRVERDPESESRRHRPQRTARVDRMRITGLDETQLDDFWRTGRDHAGNPATPFVDDAGRWPLRCCLTDSAAGDELAIVAWSPFPWRGPYAETGPVVVHARPCPGAGVRDRVPVQFRGRRQVLRPYGWDRRIAYDHARLVEADGDLDGALAELLAVDDVAFVQSRNVLAGCYSFTAERPR
jgi:hypothetical protein